MDIRHLSRNRFLSTVGWGLIASLAIVSIAAGLGRATVNLQGALIDKPDIAIYLLLPEEGIRNVELLRENETERHYLTETKSGPKLVVLKKGETEWYVSLIEKLRADTILTEPSADTEGQAEETAPSP